MEQIGCGVFIFADSVGHGRSSKPSDGLGAHFPNYDYGDMVGKFE
jgi:homoserine O-acetyltransferase